MGINKYKLSKNPETLTRIIDSNAVVIFLSDDYDDNLKREVYIFNNTGTRIWDLINGKNNLKQIVHKIYGEYDLTLQKAKEQINKFINKLIENKLINIVKRETK